jgi:hypothetical protein
MPKMNRPLPKQKNPLPQINNFTQFTSSFPQNKQPVNIKLNKMDIKKPSFL